MFGIGEYVEVKGLSEILASLDADGAPDGLPFMPEMKSSAVDDFGSSPCRENLCRDPLRYVCAQRVSSGQRRHSRWPPLLRREPRRLSARLCSLLEA